MKRHYTWWHTEWGWIDMPKTETTVSAETARGAVKQWEKQPSLYCSGTEEEEKSDG